MLMSAIAFFAGKFLLGLTGIFIFLNENTSLDVAF